MKIMTVVGARPQFIKASILSRMILENHQKNICEEILHTGQHYDFNMSQIFFNDMQIPDPIMNLHINPGSHAYTTAQMITGIESELLTRKPDYLLLYGDTNSTLAGALAASKLNIPIIHVEAGERSYNRNMPEEINRLLTDHLSAFLFCCSAQAQLQLAQEGISKNVHIVGDIMYDAFLYYSQKSIWPAGLKKISSPFVLATLHRAENTDSAQQLASLFDALSEIPEIIILPLHPRTRKNLTIHNIKIAPNIYTIEPTSYLETLDLLKNCIYVITDSGGVQKESYYAGKKCITTRNETEWTELVGIGANKVVGTEKMSILNATSWAKTKTNIPKNIYGDGKTAEKILEILM